MLDKKCCGATTTMPWMSLYRRCINALRAMENKQLSVNWLMAICVAESGGNSLWLGNNELLAQNCKALEKFTGIKHDEWLTNIRIRTGANRGSYPKFRFEPSWWKQINREELIPKFTDIEIAVYACSWGIAQKSGLYLEKSVISIETMQHLRLFSQSEALQLNQLICDLQELYFESKGQTPLMFSRYNEGASAKYVNDYGRMVSGMAVGLKEAILKENLPLCLD